MKRKTTSVPIQAQAAQPSMDPAMHGAICFYSASIYKTFEQLGYDAAKEAADDACEASLRCPLWIRNEKGKFPDFEIRNFGSRSSIFCIAIQAAFLVWACKGENLPEGQFLSAARDGYKLWAMEKKGA